MMTSINGHNLNVEVHGPPDGPAVVLLHHGLGSVYSWQAQIPALVAAGYRTIAYDRWGYGHSDVREQLSMPYFEDDLRDLQALLDLLQIQSTALVGHSDGGTIALYYAARHAKQVTAVVPIAAHIYFEPKMRPGIEGVKRAFENDPNFRQGLWRLHADKVDLVFQAWYRGWRRPENQNWDLCLPLEHISCPTLVVQGMEDEHATPQHARDLAAAIPGARLWLLPEAGHMLPQDFPDVFNARLTSFLDECFTIKE